MERATVAATGNNPAASAPAILCAGIIVEDFLFKLDRFPAPGEKISADVLVRTTGGCAANAAIAVARLGGRARFAGPIGSDEASRRVLDGLTHMGVEPSGIQRVDGGSVSISAIFIDRHGEKMVATRRGEKLAEARASDPAVLLAGTDIVVADNRFPDFVQPICEAARARGLAVVLDIDKATHAADPLFKSASHVIFSAEALRGTTGQTDLAAALSHAAAGTQAFLAVTDGPGDVLWLEQGVVRRMPAFVTAAVDTLGAGDVFHGAFALALAEGREVIAAMRFAAAAAAIKCTRFGGIAGTPDRAETEAFLREHRA